jgi:hypothetical protein
MKKEKTYNPFKMVGSWIGATVFIIYFLSVYILPQEIANKIGYTNLVYISPIALLEKAYCSIGECFPFWSIITFPIIGFIYGWLIHSLVRRLKN